MASINGKEEDYAVGKSSKSDQKFDTVIGYIEDIIVDDEFQTLQNDYMDKHCQEFEDTEENKFSYTDIHKEYTALIEKYIGEQLSKRIPDFSMDEFQKQLVSRKNELEGEVFEMMLTFSDFLAFKDMMVDYRAHKEGRGVDLSMGLTVTSLGSVPSTNGNATFGLGVSATPLCVGGSGLCVQGSTQVSLMDSEEAMVEGGNTPRLDCGDLVTRADIADDRSCMDTQHPDTTTSSKIDPMMEQNDATMESPRH